MTASTEKQIVDGKSRFARYFAVALMFSLVLHVLVFERASSWKMVLFQPSSYDQIVPRTFHMKHVEIDPASLEVPVPSVTPLPGQGEVKLPEEHPMAEPGALGKTGDVVSGNEVKIPEETPQAAPMSTFVNASPDLPHDDLVKMVQNRSVEASAGSPDPLGVGEALAAAAGSSGAKVPGFSSLDELLEGKQALTSSTAPILMPTDLLFEYDASQLRPQAEESLRKLGTLLKRNGKATFRIEGYTDSFGTDEYNMALSLRRAESVRDWLVGQMGIDPAQVTTAGYGKKRLLVPATGSIAQQQLNRRVEIVVTSH